MLKFNDTLRGLIRRALGDEVEITNETCSGRRLLCQVQNVDAQRVHALPVKELPAQGKNVAWLKATYEIHDIFNTDNRYGLYAVIIRGCKVMTLRIKVEAESGTGYGQLEIIKVPNNPDSKALARSKAIPKLQRELARKRKDDRFELGRQDYVVEDGGSAMDEGREAR